MFVVPVYYDFSSTLCYVAHHVLGGLAGELSAMAIELDWQPIDLAPITGWRRGAAITGQRRDNVLRTMSDLGVQARMPAQWIDSRLAHAVSLRLANTPAEPAWRERVWSAVFAEGRSIEDGHSLMRLASDLDLSLDLGDEAALREAIDDQTRQAYAAGVRGVPTLMLDGWPFCGIQEASTMLALLRRYLRKKRREERG